MPETKEITKQSGGQPPATITPMQMLQTAVEQGANLEMLSKLMDLQERWEKNEARKAFVAALSAFKAEPLQIRKNKSTNFTSRRTGGTTEYDYLTLPEAIRVIAPALSKHGLSHAWSISQSDGKISVTCTLTHSQGHSESVTLGPAPADDSGSKNPIQQIASTVTYLERYSLLAITGLSADDMDDDGKAAGDVECISEEQMRTLEDMLDATGTNLNRFLAWANIESLSDMPANSYPTALNMLKAKEAQK